MAKLYLMQYGSRLHDFSALPACITQKLCMSYVDDQQIDSVVSYGGSPWGHGPQSTVHGDSLARR